jgi:hypothetical protein
MMRGITGTIAAIEGELIDDGLVRRWSRANGPDEAPLSLAPAG